MTRLLFLCFFFVVLKFRAQEFQTSTKEIAATDIEQLYLKLDEVFELSISSESTDVIQLKTSSEGIYSNQIGLITKREDKTMKVHSAFREILTSGFDKLSSTKSFSFKVSLIIPKNLKVIIYSNSATLKTSGSFSYLEAHLVAGSCFLRNFHGKGFIESIRGDVLARAEEVTIKGQSNHGKTDIAPGFDYGPVLSLNSVEGNITAKHP